MAAKLIFLDLLNSRMYLSIVYVEIHAGAASGGGVRQLTIISSGSRIFLGGGGTSYQSGIILQTFCRTLHENEGIWTPR